MADPALIEAMARAMYAEGDNGDDLAWDKVPAHWHEPFLRQARAVLAALRSAGMAVVPRKPNSDMLLAAAASLGNFGYSVGVETRLYEAMVGAVDAP